MKKFRNVIFVSLFVFVSCFLDTADDFTRVNLAFAAPPPAGTANIHVAVFFGVVSPETLLSVQSFAAGTFIPLVLPTGPYRVFLIWATDNAGLVNYIGVSLPVNLESDITATVPVGVDLLTQAAWGFNFGAPNHTWNAFPGATTYYVGYENNGFITIEYEGSLPSADYTNFGGFSSIYLRMYSRYFNIYSDWYFVHSS